METSLGHARTFVIDGIIVAGANFYVTAKICQLAARGTV